MNYCVLVSQGRSVDHRFLVLGSDHQPQQQPQNISIGGFSVNNKCESSSSTTLNLSNTTSTAPHGFANNLLEPHMQLKVNFLPTSGSTTSFGITRRISRRLPLLLAKGTMSARKALVTTLTSDSKGNTANLDEDKFVTNLSASSFVQYVILAFIISI